MSVRKVRVRQGFIPVYIADLRESSWSERARNWRVTAARSLAFGASSQRVRLIVLTLDDIRSVVTCDQDLVDLLIRAWIQALASGGVGLT